VEGITVGYRSSSRVGTVVEPVEEAEAVDLREEREAQEGREEEVGVE
jgi:hypothetical protein